ncbi:MAG: D-glycero-beta-D-manno-heptose 1,7-bisphosphate 7-phosphatase [Acidobacteriota bacterium]
MDPKQNEEATEAGRRPVRPGIFVDRDGTLIREVGYLRAAEDVELLPGAAAAVRRANTLGIPVLLVTNQSAVARGWLTEAELAAIHEHLIGLLRLEGARLDGLYYCPHHPEGVVAEYRTACACRKPSPGLLLRAARDFRLDLSASVMIGDKLIDVEAGRRAGTRTVLVETGYGREQAADPRIAELRPDHRAADLAAAIDWFVGELGVA